MISRNIILILITYFPQPGKLRKIMIKLGLKGGPVPCGEPGAECIEYCAPVEAVLQQVLEAEGIASNNAAIRCNGSRPSLVKSGDYKKLVHTPCLFQRANTRGFWLGKAGCWRLPWPSPTSSHLAHSAAQFWGLSRPRWSFGTVGTLRGAGGLSLGNADLPVPRAKPLGALVPSGSGGGYFLHTICYCC